MEFAGPQPRSMIRFGEVRGTRESKSRAGCVRSFSNLRYCVALQSLAAIVVVVNCLGVGRETLVERLNSLFGFIQWAILV